MGRSGLDLYSTDVGLPFTEITSFAAYVGGSPTNISVGARRLGLEAAILTAVGDDLVGDFVLSFLQREGVETAFISRKRGFRTAAALLGIEPPDRFQLVYYRDNCADSQLDLGDVLGAPIADSRVLQLAGTNLSREPSRTATIAAAEIAHSAGTRVVLDLDFRADQWSDPRLFGLAIRSLLRWTDIVIGTTDEVNAAVLVESGDVLVEHFQVSAASVAGDTESSVAAVMALGPRILVRKTGAEGAVIYARTADLTIDRHEVSGFPVEICNLLGAGDAFAAGFIYGYLNGWELGQAARLGNACGAFVVSRHGCSTAMPTLDEISSFVSVHEQQAPSVVLAKRQEAFCSGE